MIEAPDTGRTLHIIGAMESVGNEWRWHVEDAEGTTMTLAQLRPELASDIALERRYRYETQRIAALHCEGIAKTLALGPQDSAGVAISSDIAPWRLAIRPPGQRMHKWLDERAPVAVDETLEIIVALCKTVHQLHQEGFVLRDLEPRNIVMLADSGISLTDLGLARIDILSSRSASSLLLESSPYAAPEHLRATVIDARADLFTIAAIAWHALTGTVPFDQGSPFIRDYSALAALTDFSVSGTSEVDPKLDTILRSCLSEDPEERPSSARELAEILQGSTEKESLALARVPCQACGNMLRTGMRLCLHCGKQAIQFRENDAEEGEGYSLYLKRATDNEEFHSGLVRFFLDIGESPPEHLNFLSGDSRLYSKAEKSSRIHLPALLLSNLSKESADSLHMRLKAEGYKVVVKKVRNIALEQRKAKQLTWLGAGIASAGIGLAVATGTWLLLIPGFIGIPMTIVGLVRQTKERKKQPLALAGLRKAPLALPASDPLVAKIAAALSEDIRDDVREQVSKIALLLQRLCDHRTQNAGDKSDIELIVEPLERLVDLLSSEIHATRAIDKSLATLDEGELVRAIAASEAREEPSSKRVHFLDGLDKLRVLEDKRADHMGALLEAASLLRSLVEEGLRHGNEKHLEQNRITSALAGL